MADMISASSATDPCHSPQSPQEQDLCQQWRMAEGTEWLVRLTGGELLLVFIAVGIASWAAFEARNAARAARITVDAMDKFSRIELRAYTSAMKASMASVGGEMWTAESPQFIFTIRNHGNTPAKNVRQAYRVRIADAPPQDRLSAQDIRDT